MRGFDGEGALIALWAMLVSIVFVVTVIAIAINITTIITSSSGGRKAGCLRRQGARAS